MQQNYICLNTAKNLKEAEEIVKNLEMEVILKLDKVVIDLQDLSKEEKGTWVDSLGMQMDRALDAYHMSEKIFRDIASTSKRYAEEIRDSIKSYKRNPDFDIVGSIKALNKREEERVIDRYSESLIMRYDLTRLPLLHVYGYAECSILIAKKGENMLRYVGILDNNDPIVTITGPDAQSLLIGWKGTSYSTKNVSYHSS